jgi:hypothetical protein
VLNPAFGQGVGKILSEITVLNTILSETIPPSSTASVPPQFSHKFFPRAQAVTVSMYDMNRMLDYGYGTTTPQEGDTLAFGEWFRNYFFNLMGVCEKVRLVAYWYRYVKSNEMC